ncbi:unnamed protein product [Acanthoscelides obtectus]|uniref:Uncharacterized protein n=1 Tax=Acanthoscelides obtectus TaxID=200917 RepID=A0A9P0K828_ACAOB|nr:unnamed protein product [Acanthoscelides obtectus]CAK1657034.1 hypothetical protein AOBTE_LOCUS20075 [Acanthoscelides obtectus]
MFSKIAGVWLEPETSSTRKRVFFILIIKTIMGELLLLVPHMAMLINNSVGILEIAILIYNRAKLAELKCLLQSESFEYEECNSANIVENSKTTFFGWKKSGS